MHYFHTHQRVTHDVLTAIAADLDELRAHTDVSADGVTITTERADGCAVTLRLTPGAPSASTLTWAVKVTATSDTCAAVVSSATVHEPHELAYVIVTQLRAAKRTPKAA